MTRRNTLVPYSHASPRSAARHASAECSTRKLGFEQKATARTEAARMSRERGGKEFAVYRCPECRLFHLTSRWAEGLTTNGTRRKVVA
jgi:hypothetical protein